MDYQYQLFRTESIEQLKNLRPADIHLFSEDSINENITIVARPDDGTIKIINQLIEELKKKEKQYYYSPDQLHITLLGEINTKITDEKVIQVLDANLPKYDLRFKLFGLGSNGYASSVSAYPLFNIHALRNDIRNNLLDNGSDYTVHLKLFEYMGWINYMRYLDTPSHEFIEKLYSYIDTEFGEMVTTRVEVYRNRSKVLDKAKAELIYVKSF